jgi:hypothetical protein
MILNGSISSEESVGPNTFHVFLESFEFISDLLGQLSGGGNDQSL